LIGLYGGTFDPVHLGHLHAGRSVCAELGLTRLRLLLSARPGHRDAPSAPAAARWAMLCLACAEHPMLVPDDLEILRAARQAAPSYTVDTLLALRRAHPDAPVLWVIGSDALAGLPTWHRWRAVPELAHLVVLQRPGAVLPQTGPVGELLAARRVETAAPELRSAPAGAIVVLELEMLPISATAVRDALTAGAPVDKLLPPAVNTYIQQHRLYGVRGDPGKTA
jgi:nicotinate-nucleotide adenylyltransferase